MDKNTLALQAFILGCFKGADVTVNGNMLFIKNWDNEDEYTLDECIIAAKRRGNLDIEIVELGQGVFVGSKGHAKSLQASFGGLVFAVSLDKKNAEMFPQRLWKWRKNTDTYDFLCSQLLDIPVLDLEEVQQVLG